MGNLVEGGVARLQTRCVPKVNTIVTARLYVWDQNWGLRNWEWQFYATFFQYTVLFGVQKYQPEFPALSVSLSALKPVHHHCLFCPVCPECPCLGIITRTAHCLLPKSRPKQRQVVVGRPHTVTHLVQSRSTNKRFVYHMPSTVQPSQNVKLPR